MKDTMEASRLRWERATRAVLAGRKPRKRRVVSLTPSMTLAEFVESPAGKAARALLRAKNTYVLLTRSEVAMSRSTFYAFDEEGLGRSTQLVGMAAAYSTEVPRVPRATAREALRAAHDYEGLGEADVLEKIYQALDELANSVLYEDIS